LDITRRADSYIWTPAHLEHGSLAVNILSKATLIPALWLLSFLGSFLLFPISDAVQTAAVVTLLVSLLGYAACTGAVTFKYSPLTILICLLWGVAAISVMFSAVPFISLTYFFFFSAFPLTFLVFSLEDSAKIWMPVRLMILALGVVNLIQFYFFPSMLKFGGAHWPLADNNSLAVILGAGALLFIGESLKGGRRTYHNIAAAVVLFAALMTTGGTAVFLGFFLVLAVFVFLARPVTYKPVGVFMSAVIVLMLAMTTSELSVYHFFGSWSDTVNVFFDKGIGEPNKVSGSRLFIWKAGINIFLAYPFLGTGIGTFFLYYPEFRNINEESAGYMAHNDFIQIASEMGIFAPLIALAIIGFLFYATGRRLRGMDDRLNILIPFSVFGLIIGHSLVNFNMYVLPTLMLMGVLLATWNTQIASKEIVIGANKTLREGICFVIVMAMVVPLLGCYLSEYYTNKATEDIQQQNIQGFSDHLNLADKWSAGQNGRAVLQGARFAFATDHPDRALELLDRAQALNPRLVQIYVERAQILFSMHDAEKALVQAQEALRLDDASMPARLMVIDILEGMGRSDEAYTVMKAGLKGVMRSRDPITFYQKLAVKSLEHMDFETNNEVLVRLKRLQTLK
jgi:O-antigen ligase